MTIRILDPEKAKKRIRDNVASWKREKLLKQDDAAKGSEQGAEEIRQLNSMLFRAAQEGDHEEVGRLLERGADPNALDIDDTDDRDRTSVLCYACRSASLETVKALLEKGAKPDPPNNRPLLSASYYGCTMIVKLLLEHGADVNGCDNAGFTPLASAFDYEMHLETVRFLIEAGADVNAVVQGRSLLQRADEKEGKGSYLSRLLEKAGAKE